MEIQRNILIVVLVALSFVLYQRWQVFQQNYVLDNQTITQNSEIDEQPTIEDIPEVSEYINNNEYQVPSPAQLEGADLSVEPITVAENIIDITTDLVYAKIDTTGGTIVFLELKEEPETIEQPGIGFKLLKTSNTTQSLDLFIARGGLIGRD